MRLALLQQVYALEWLATPIDPAALVGSCSCELPGVGGELGGMVVCGAIGRSTDESREV